MTDRQPLLDYDDGPGEYDRGKYLVADIVGGLVIFYAVVYMAWHFFGGDTWR